MQPLNFEKLYIDFKEMFDLCRYTDESLKEEILKKAKDSSITQGLFLFRFRLVIFKFEVIGDSISYIGYEK